MPESADERLAAQAVLGCNRLGWDPLSLSYFLGPSPFPSVTDSTSADESLACCPPTRHLKPTLVLWLEAGARGAAGDEDRFSLSRTGPMMQRCTFLVPTGSTATHRHVPKCQVLGCVIPALLFDTSDAAMEDHLRNSNILIHDVDEAVLTVMHIYRYQTGMGAFFD